MTTPAQPAFWRTTPGILSILVVVGAVLLIGARVVGELTRGDVDASVTRCALVGSRDRPAVDVGVLVTNRGEGVRDVVVQVDVSDPAGAGLATVEVRARGVAPGRTVTASESTVLSGRAAAVTCEVEDVS